MLLSIVPIDVDQGQIVLLGRAVERNQDEIPVQVERMAHTTWSSHILSYKVRGF